MKTTPSVALALLATFGLLAACAVGCNKSSASAPAVDQDLVMKMRAADAAAGGAAGGGDSGTGWGTLKGVFRYNGTPAAPTKFPTEKDPLCKAPVYTESLVVNAANKGLRNVVIYARNVPRVTPDYAAAAAKDALFDQKECRFLDHVFASSVKDKFVILNSDDATHNSKGDPGSGNPSYNELIPAKTGKYEYKFKKELPFPYDITCSIHPWMKAYHIVRPDPYFAVTNENGEFTIEKLPAGVELEFQVWHELGAAGDKGQLKAQADWSAQGRFKKKIANDGDTVTMEVTVEPSALKSN